MTLTILDGTHNIGFQMRMSFEHGGKAFTSVFGCALATMTVEDSEATIMASSSEVIFDHELIEKAEG